MIPRYDSYIPPHRTSWRPSLPSGRGVDRWVPTAPAQRRNPTHFKDRHEPACPRALRGGQTTATIARDPYHHNRSSSSDEPRIMPKFFDQPLTCFYWATQRSCSKSDEDCWYAHYDTGLIASAPVRVGGAPVAVAGKGAQRRTRQLSDTEEKLKIIEAREAVVEAHERHIENERQHITKNTLALQSTLKQIYHALETLDDSYIQASRSLRSRRNELARMVAAEQALGSIPIERALTTVTDTIADLTDFKDQISATAYTLKGSAGVVDINLQEAEIQTTEDAMELSIHEFKVFAEPAPDI